MNTYQAYLQPQRSLLGAEGPGYQGMVMPPPTSPGKSPMPPTSSLYRDPRAETVGNDNWWNRMGNRFGYIPPHIRQGGVGGAMDFFRRRGGNQSYFNPANYNNPAPPFRPGMPFGGMPGGIYSPGYQRPVYGGRPNPMQMPIQYVQPNF